VHTVIPGFSDFFPGEMSKMEDIASNSLDSSKNYSFAIQLPFAIAQPRGG
jgi:hypothetical protein